MTLFSSANKENLKRLLPLLFVFCTFLWPLNATSTDALPAWWGNSLGKDPIVLPGYSPIEVDETTLSLGAGRSYEWSNSFLPEPIFSRHQRLVDKFYIEAKINGETKVLHPTTTTVTEGSPHHVLIESRGSIDNKLKILIHTRVEYDGVGMVELELIPASKVRIQKLTIVARVQANEWTKMLSFNKENIGNRLKQVVGKPSYSGDFLNALAIINGEVGFWMFQDNAAGWVGHPDKAVSVKTTGSLVEVRQNLINEETDIKESLDFKFNFMASPVKDSSGNAWANRALNTDGNKKVRYHGLSLWWTNAFAHQVLPYTELPEKAKQAVTIEDKQAYPGLEENKKILKKYKRAGVDRLPYFSGHVLNYLDPAYQQFKDSWEVHPRVVWNKLKYDNPFKSVRNDAFLTHRAEGYTDYLIYRFSELIDELGIEGLYFDQGTIWLSENKSNGAWHDYQGKLQGSTDILAMRNFHKRLATLLYKKGKKSLIVSHNSKAPILPAYTFVTAMLQGEEFNHLLKNYDYIDSVSMDEVRTRLATSAFGVPSIWLEVIFAANSRLALSNRPKNLTQSQWKSSDYYKKAYHNFMTLALLHDIPVWSLVDVREQNRLLRKIDWIKPENSTFTGYWNFSESLFKNKIYFSFYQSKSDEKLLFIIANLNDQRKLINLNELIESIGFDQGDCEIIEHPIFDVPLQENSTSVEIAAKSNLLIPYSCRNHS